MSIYDGICHLAYDASPTTTTNQLPPQVAQDICDCAMNHFPNHREKTSMLHKIKDFQDCVNTTMDTQLRNNGTFYKKVVHKWANDQCRAYYGAYVENFGTHTDKKRCAKNDTDCVYSAIRNAAAYEWMPQVCHETTQPGTDAYIV